MRTIVAAWQDDEQDVIAVCNDGLVMFLSKEKRRWLPIAAEWDYSIPQPEQAE
jgi:hypothetical protein